MLSYLVKFQVKLAAMRDDHGATAVEYGLMVGLIAVVIIGAVTVLVPKVNSLFSTVATSVYPNFSGSTICLRIVRSLARAGLLTSPPLLHLCLLPTPCPVDVALVHSVAP